MNETDVKIGDFVRKKVDARDRYLPATEGYVTSVGTIFTPGDGFSTSFTL